MIETGRFEGPPRVRSTTVVAVRREGKGAMGGDGQVTLEDKTVIKHGARKVRRLYDGKVLAGFAGSVADALMLFDKFEGRLRESRGNLPRAVVELAKEWRTDRILRRLDALLMVMDASDLLLVSGGGEVIQPDDGVAAIGSGGPYALAAARALLAHTSLSARDVVEESLKIAASICVFTNDDLAIEEI